MRGSDSLLTWSPNLTGAQWQRPLPQSWLEKEPRRPLKVPATIGSGLGQGLAQWGHHIHRFNSQVSREQQGS